ncbi:MAG: hypothetical protein KAU48_04580 [Candidatus Thorarchaeota archaeon]|nr:hypothetical protein [Candidatus Thorarchaeota archaeon]
MRLTDWRDTIVVISAGLIILITSLLLITTGNDELLLVITSVLAPLVALILGIIGLRIYGKESAIKDDKYNTLNLWLAIGLIMLSLAEIARTLVGLAQSPHQMLLIVALAQMPGLILWGLGIIQYLRSLNSSLGFVKSNNLWIGFFLVATLSTISLVVIIMTQFTTIDLIESLVLSPIIVGLTLLTIITTILVWIFRKGTLAKPLFLILGALALYLVRVLLWLFVDASLDSPTDGVIAIESFILCGGALLLARDLGKIDT